MQFTHPGMLWALFLLIIPIIIHLFQLRKFRKEAFTNVALLKKIEVQTRKSAQLKKWLIFMTRMLAATAIIIAFSQPYYANKEISETKNDLVIYLDNSFSMQARGNNGVLLRKAIQDIIENVSEDITFTLLTNDKVFKNTTIKAIKDQLLKLDYSPGKFDINDAILKGNTAFTTKNSSRNDFILLSDFQQNEPGITIQKDSLTTLRLVKLKPQNTNNIVIDSLYISEKKPDGFTLAINLTRQGKNSVSVPVSLFNDKKLLAKASAAFEKEENKTQAYFDISSEEIIKGKASIEEESGLLFDNAIYFTIDQKEKINVLAINEADASFLERIYTDEEFTLTSITLDALDYNTIFSQDVIILNELKNIPIALITTLQSFKSKAGSIIIIPSEEESYSSYNQILRNFNFGELSTRVLQEKKIITIAYSHPVFKNVFEKQVQNFQYPGAKQFYTFKGTASPVLQFESNAPFLLEKNNIYLFTAPLNDANSNFKNSPLIVPVFYNIGKSSMQLPQPYYTIGNQNKFDVKTTLQKDAILSLTNTVTAFIPQQQAFDGKVQLSTYEDPEKAGTYSVQSGENTITHVSFNYNRNESNLRYHNIDTLKNIASYKSIPQLFTTIKNENNTTALWKWFVIFALAFLITEFVLLKFFK